MKKERHELKIITAKQAKEIDLTATQQLGISTLIMMENPGIRIADFVLEILKKKLQLKKKP